MLQNKTENRIYRDSDFVKWNESYSVGITEINQRNQMLISLINDLSDSMVQEKGRDSNEKILDELGTYTTAHFAAEERLFDKYGYPWSVTHKAEHQAFARRVTTFTQEYKLGKTGLSNQTLLFLSDWVKQHIIGKDKTYTYYFINKGLN
jgi:hemerythrin